MRSFVNQTAVDGRAPDFARLLPRCHGVSALIPRPTEFETARALKEFAVSSGLVFHCGNTSGVACSNYLLSDHPIEIDVLAGVSSRRDCGLTPAWRGVLWVCQPGESGLCTDSIGGKWRVWGNVLVAGDEALMDRIEELYHNK